MKAKVVENEQAQLMVYVVVTRANGEAIATVEALTLKPFTKDIPGRDGSTSESGNADFQLAAELFALPATEREFAVCNYLHGRVAEVMGTPIDEIPLDKPLDGLGLDSLMAFELRDELERNLNVMIPMEVFLQEITLSEFSGLVAEKLVSPGISASPYSPYRQDSDDTHGENWIEGEI